MTAYLPEFLTVMVVHLLALMSPGPDFVMISRSSLVHSRAVALWASVGLGLGILVHVTYSIVGIGVLIAQSIVLFSILKWLGAAYLIWIGWHALRAPPVARVDGSAAAMPRQMSIGAAIRLGFLTNALNPKATLFFLALFTQVIDPRTPRTIQCVYGAAMALLTMLWFSAVALVLSHSVVHTRFARIQHYVERTFGAILIALGIKVALSECDQ